MKRKHQNQVVDAKEAIPLLRYEYAQQEPMHSTLAFLCEWHAQNRDWGQLRTQIQELAKASTDISFFTDVALTLLELAENALADPQGRLPGSRVDGAGQAGLVMVTELGLHLADKGSEMALESFEAARVVDYITSSLLSKSNINNPSLRLSLVYYFSKISKTPHTNPHLLKVLNRFGQSMLDDLLQSYFSKKKKEHVVLQFFIDHLHIFFISSPSIAEMAQSVLKHNMLRYPDDFASFLANYSEYHEKESLKIQVFTRLTTSLIRNALEVSRGELAERMGAVLLEHLNLYKTQPRSLLEAECQRMEVLLSAAGLAKPMQLMASELMGRLKKALGATATGPESLVLPKSRFSAAGKPKSALAAGALPKVLKFTEKISPLDCLIRMAS